MPSIFDDIRKVADSRKPTGESKPPVSEVTKPTVPTTSEPTAKEALAKRVDKVMKDQGVTDPTKVRQSNIFYDFARTAVKEGIPKLLKGLVGGVEQTGVGEAEELAKMHESFGRTEEAARIRNGEAVREVNNLRDEDIVDMLEKPSVMRSVSRGFAEYVPATIAALRSGRIDPKQFSSFGAKGVFSTMVREAQADLIPSLLIEYMDRDPNSSVAQQIDRGSKGVPLSLGVSMAMEGILGAGGVVGRKVLQKTLPSIRETIDNIKFKKARGEPVSNNEINLFLEDQKMKRILTPEETPKAVAPVVPNAVEPKPAEVLAKFTGKEGEIDDTMFLNAARQLLEKPESPKKSFAQRLTGGIKKRAASIQDALIDRFAPLGRAEKSIYATRGTERPRISLAEEMQLSAGMEGKAVADTLDFEKEIVDHVLDKTSTKSYDGFNEYLLLKRIKDRVASDPKRKKVVQRSTNEKGVLKFEWGEEAADAGLRALKKEIGDENFLKFELLGQKYQAYMDRVLRVQVEAGKLSEASYKQIKDSNKFYAPFKVLKELDLEESAVDVPARGLSSSDTIVKKIQGISGDEDFFINDIIAESYDQIYKGRLLAEKNRKMQKVLDLAELDTEGKFFKILDKKKLDKARGVTSKEIGETDLRPKKETPVPRNWTTSTVWVNGEKIRVATDPVIGKSIRGMGRGEMHVFSTLLRAAATPFKAGATAFNIPFQIKNFIFNDPVRQAVLSRYGVKSGTDTFKYIFQDYPRAIAAAVKGSFDQADELYTEFMRSDAFNSVVQRNLTPELFRNKKPPKSVLQKYGRYFNVFSDVAKLGSALEQAGKITGFKRGLEAVNKKNGVKGLIIDNNLLKTSKGYADDISEMLLEVRNFGGSPDFFRGGNLSPDMNLLFMFFNARVQGTVADIGRLGGVKGGGTKEAWARLSMTMTPVILNHLRNKEFYQDDLNSLQDWEKENYINIFTDKTFINDDGQLVRDSIKIPKREIMKIASNVSEIFIDFLYQPQYETRRSAVLQLLEELSPINIQLTGNQASFQRNIETVGGQLNPALRVPAEMFAGKSFFTGNPIVPRSMEDVEPWAQFRDSTPEVYKWMAMKLKDSPLAPEFMKSPEKLRNVVDGMFGGVFSQFQTHDVADDRSGVNAILAKYGMTRSFVRSEYVDEHAIQEDISKFQMEGKTEDLTNRRWAEKWWNDYKQLPKEKRDDLADEIKKYPKGTLEERKKFAALERVAELDSVGMSYTDRMALNAKAGNVEDGQFARFIYDIIFQKYTRDPQERSKLMKTWNEKGIVNKTILNQLSAITKKYGKAPYPTQ